MELPQLSLARTFTECCASAAPSPTPAAAWQDMPTQFEDGVLPPTDTLDDEVALLQQTIEEFFVRMRVLLDKLERRTTA